MERRNRSLEALGKLQYIDSLEEFEKGESLLRWGSTYLQEDSFELTIDEMKIFIELFYKNINFLKNNKEIIKKELDNHQNIKKFFT